MTAGCPGPVAANKPKVAVFLPNVVTFVLVGRLHFVFPNDIVPEVMWFFLMQLCKPKLCCHALLKGKRLPPGKQVILVQSFF